MTEEFEKQATAKGNELAKKFFAQQDESILEGLKDLVAKGRLNVEYHPMTFRHCDQMGEVIVTAEQRLKVVAVKHPLCTSCESFESDGMGYCNLLQMRFPKNFYCASHSLERQPYEEE